MAKDQFEETFGKGRGRGTVHDENEALRERAYELECKLADERAEPRPGEDFRLELSAVGGGSCSYFAEDRPTKVLVHAKGFDGKSVKRTAINLLCTALLPENINVGWPSTDGVRSMHASICGCAACGQGGLSPEDPDREDS